eukprot:TRINITY_DN13113_c0_g1_i1.p1 TRINITY_DN13113_c0_g1~~TRINITY_DN13113_c0_g1_i1.p1  ORF type:complete len:346 (+),score=68.98 TRINITY_DN13113_c0_g1_i1:67-1104(+)
MPAGAKQLTKPIEAKDASWLEKMKLDLTAVPRSKKASKRDKAEMIDRLYGKVYKEQQLHSPRKEKTREEALRSGWRAHGPENVVSPRKVSKKRLDISERLHRNHTRATDPEWINLEQEKHQQLLYPGQPDCKQVRFDTIHILTGGQPQPGTAEILQTTQYVPKSEQRSRSRSMRAKVSPKKEESKLSDDETYEESIVLHEDVSTRRGSESTMKSRPPDVASDASYDSSRSRESSPERKGGQGRQGYYSSSDSSTGTDTEDELSPRYKRYFSTLTSQSKTTSCTADHTTDYDQSSTDTASEAPTAATSVSKQFFECSATIIGTEHVDMNTTQASLSYCQMSESGYE